MTDFDALLFLPIPIALFISWIWVDYFQQLDIYNKKAISKIVLTFVLGAVCYPIVDVLGDFILDPLNVELNGNYVNDFLYSVFGIGLIEESVKLLPWLFVLAVFPREFNEPIDYIGFAAFSALGFVAFENATLMQDSGLQVLVDRCLLPVVGHIFDAAIAAYGFVLFRYKKPKIGWAIIPILVLAASLSHGIHDYFLISPQFSNGGYLLTILYYMFTVSIFATMANNCINNSSYFTYKKVIRSHHILRRLAGLYGVVLVIAALAYAHHEGYWGLAPILFLFYIAYPGVLITLVAMRLSRFTLIQGKWLPIRMELPFFISVFKRDPFGMSIIHVKGEGYDETRINKYYQDYCSIEPLSYRATFIKEPRKIFIDKKIFLAKNESYYLAKVFKDDYSDEYYYFLIKPKLKGNTLINKKWPIAALMQFDGNHDLSSENLDRSDFTFKEWVTIRDLNEVN